MLSVNQLDSRRNTTLLPGQSITALDGSAQLLNDPELGPVLTGAGAASPLWQLPSAPSANAMPGRLVMQDDGNLVFYGRDNQALWATNTGNPAGASSRLTLTGRYVAATPAASTLKLHVLNYSANTIAATLYPAV